MKRLVSWIYAPAFLFGFIGCGLWQPDALILLFIAAVGVSFLVEQWLPYEPQWNRSLGDRRRRRARRRKDAVRNRRKTGNKG